MANEPKDWDEFLTQAAAAAGLDIPDDIRPQVLGHFSILAGHAATVMAVALDDEIEPAPVFRP